MTNRSARAAARLAFIFCSLTCPATLLWAQNENESVGFQTNHPFESGHFGEDIDILNGNLHLSIPIGPTYQLNQYFGYQLVASYNSKVWDMSRWDANADAKLQLRGNLGLGFNLNFGRIYRDVEFKNAIDPPQCTWFYVSPDGNEHELPVSITPIGGDACSYVFEGDTVDNSFIRVSGQGGIPTWDGNPATAPTLTVTTPDGTVYTFGHMVQVYKGTAPLNSTVAGGIGDQSGDVTSYNRDYGGWYVTRITNGRANSATAYVQINYNDPHPVGFEHLISSIVDSQNRTITFVNGCQAAATPSGCVEVSLSP